MTNEFHCCASCKYFEVRKTDKKIYYTCSRLKYETKPSYQFTCWDPKRKVVELMNKRLGTPHHLKT